MGQFFASNKSQNEDEMESLNLIEDDLQEVQVDEIKSSSQLCIKENDFKMILINLEPIDFSKEVYLIQDNTEKMK